MSKPQQFCTFVLDDHLFGLNVRHVQEVTQQQRMTRVPLAPTMIRGLINLRGQIVTAIDLRECLGLPPLPNDLVSANVIVRSGEDTMSFLVDSAGDVLEVDSADYEQPPETLRGVAVDLIRGTYKLKDRLLLVLDMQQIIERALTVPQEAANSDEQDSSAGG